MIEMAARTTTPLTPECRPRALAKALERAKRENRTVYVHWNGIEYVIATHPLPAEHCNRFTAECNAVEPTGEMKAYTPK